MDSVDPRPSFIDRVHPAWVGFVGLLLYAQTVTFGFLSYDDPWLIVDNYVVTHPGSETLRTLLFDLTSDRRFRLGAEYLPVRDLSATLDHILFGTWAGGHHAMNVLLYGAVCALAATLILTWTANRRLAWTAGLLFAVHPLHVEAVAWLSERKGLLAGVFLLASLTLFRRVVASGSWRAWASAVLLVVLAIWSKALAITGAGLLVALVYAFPAAPGRGISPKARWTRVILYGAVAAVAFAPGLYVGKHMKMVQPYHSGGFVGTLWMFFEIHARYLAQLCMATPLGIAYPVGEGRAWLWSLAGLLLTILFLAVLAVGARPGSGPRLRLLAFASAWWFILLAPISHLVFPIQNLMADRYMLLPSLAWCIALAVLIGMLPRRTPRIALGAVTVIAVLISVLQTQTWASSRALYEREVAVFPGHTKSWNHLADEAAKTGNVQGAFVLVEQGLAHNPNDWHLLHRRALLLRAVGRHEEAFDSMRRAAADPNADTAMANLAILLLQRGKLTEARAWADRAVGVNPRDADNQRARGMVAMAQRRWPDAREAFERAAVIDPENADNQWNLGAVAVNEGHPQAAFPHWQAVKRLDPSRATQVDQALAELARRGVIPPPATP